MESEAAVAAAVVQAQKEMMSVMVAMDESEGSCYALQWTLDNILIHGTDSGFLTLVHVQQPFQPSVYPVDPGGATFFARTTIAESAKKAQAENSAEILSRASKLCNDQKMIKPETLILEGDAKEKIGQATEEMQVDLLVVGSRGLGKIKSVSDYCAHHAKCPILIAKPPKETSK